MQKKILYPRPSKSHISFSKADDEQLRKFVALYGENWGKIAEKMGKSPRQCRERYISYLDPNLVNGPWTPEEDEKLRQSVKKFGTKWVTLTKIFPGRSDNNLKNRWHTYLKHQTSPGIRPLNISNQSQIENQINSTKIETPHINPQDFHIYNSVNNQKFSQPGQNINSNEPGSFSNSIFPLDQQKYLNFSDFFNQTFELDDLLDIFPQTMF